MLLLQLFDLLHTLLNEGRPLKKWPTEFRVDLVLQPFDGSKFNFTQVGQEVIFRFEPSNDYQSRFHSCASAINVSPIEYGHVLLIPHVLDRFQQPIDAQSLLLAVCMAQEAADPFFRVGYNSLGAFATINHLHFQVLIMSFLSMLKR